jgi:hypothetical protein
VIALQEICLERGHHVAQQDVDHILRLEAAVDIVTEENQDRPAFVLASLGVLTQILKQPYQEVRTAVNVAYGVNPAAERNARGRPRGKHRFGYSGTARLTENARDATPSRAQRFAGRTNQA